MLARELQIPMLGKLMFAIPAASSTSRYEEWARNELDIPAELIKVGATAIADAFAECLGYRNDVVLAFPGAYLQTAELDWDKAHTHLFGMAGPNQGGDYSEPAVVMYTTGTAIVNTLDISGAHCQFLNVTVNNVGANAACLAAVKLDKYGCRFKNCHIAGTMAATQAAQALACSLQIEYDAHYPIFEDCIIGHDVWTTRTGANQGVILFKDGQVNGGLFKNCRILSRCETATGAFVSVVGANKLGRGWVFDNCIFDNYTTGTAMNQAFYESAANSIGDRTIILKNCVLNTNGCDAWQDDNNDTIHGTMAVANAAGGLTAEISDGS
jgi:acetyltransferase-like isoleucine patch superfamily enzyme